MTKTKFIELLGRLAKVAKIEDDSWEFQSKNLYLPQLVSWLVEELWLAEVVNNDVPDIATLREYYKKLRSTGKWNFATE